MRKLIYIAAFFFLVACDSENANDCFQKAGSIIQQEITVPSFDKILVNRDVELIIKEGPRQQVIIETGENLLNDVSASVTDGKLTLTDNNTCNYVRDFGITKVYVTSPNITEIRSSTQYDISSDGVLTYPDLAILSEDVGAPNSFTTGDFRLEINNNSLRVSFNNLSSCFVTGITNSLNVSFFAGNGRFEGANLLVENITIFHRGTNDMIVNPQQSLKGILNSTGNVISKNKPPVVEVDILFRGQLIFE
ncbi:head GIN domain-containing protein [uncultured Algibacter sp.]|uniref:head GIN domain-containing protein n=1 Tax=uncultured Algibacter sp. TaxID=298659 RepID=UPI003216B29A